MENVVIHEAGYNHTPRHTLTTDIRRSGISAERAIWLTRFTEFWCEFNCIGNWRVVETTQSISVSFDELFDAALFKLSEEFSYYPDEDQKKF